MSEQREDKKPKWYIGKSPEERRWKALRIIYDELLPDNRPIQHSKLIARARAKGRISKSTLTRRLMELENKGWVKRIVDPRTSPPSVFYLKEPLPTVVFFEISGKDNSVNVVDSFKPSSMFEFPYYQLGLPFRSSDISIEQEGVRLIPFKLPEVVRSRLGLPEDEPLLLYPISQRDKFP